MLNQFFKLLLICCFFPFTSSAQIAAFEFSDSEKENVKVLNLRKQKLKELPNEVFSFPNLEVLILQRNKLESLPDSMWHKLPKLHYVDVSQNKLSRLPEAWATLPIDTLIANRNYIAYLPASYAQMSQLSYLDLWSNELITLPDSFAQLPRLKRVDLRGISMNKRHQTKLLDAAL